MRTRPRKLNYFAPVPTGTMRTKDTTPRRPAWYRPKKHLLLQSGTIPMLPARKLLKGEDTNCPTAHRQCQALLLPRILLDPLLRAPSEFMDTVDSGFYPIWGLLEEDGTPGPRAGKPSIQAFVPVLVPLATSFLPSQPRSGLVRLRGQEITPAGVTMQFLRSLAWPALGWRLAPA